MLHWLRSDDVDPKISGQLALGGFSYMLNGVMDMRKSSELPDSQFVDSHYLDLIADPVAAIQKIYRLAELEWPRGHDDRIRGYLRDKPKGKFGKHQYSLDEYGLNSQAIDEAYARYVEYYGVASEG